MRKLTPYHRAALAVAIGITLASCAPIPHRDFLAPRVVGVVVDAGSDRPISNATVDFLFQSSTKLGTTTTDEEGRFNIGPFYQWFWLVYIGSPGVAPVPYRLRGGIGCPNSLVVSTRTGEREVFMIGDAKTHLRGNDDFKQRFRTPEGARWMASATSYSLPLRSGQKTSGLPHIHIPAPFLVPAQPR